MTNYKNKYQKLLEVVEDVGNDTTKELASVIEKMEVEEPPTITKAEIMAIRDPKERIKAINENSNLFGGNQ